MRKAGYLALALILTMSLHSTRAEDARLRTIVQYMPTITAVKGTEYVIVTEKFNHYSSIYTTNGERIVTYPFTSLSYAGYGFFTAWNTEDGKSLALVNSQGAQITEAIYGAFKVYSTKWAAGYSLTPNKKGKFTHGKARYTVDGYDFFYLGNGTTMTEPLCHINASDIKTVGVHGDYIAVQYQDKSIKVYDNEFNELDYTLKKVTDPIYKVTDYAIINGITKEIVADGYTSVKEVLVNGKLMFLVSRTGYDGAKLSGIIDMDGNRVMPTQYNISSIVGDYALITDNNGLYGLYSFERDKQIVPILFTSLPTTDTSIDKFVQNGYVIVEKEEKLGYYDIQSQVISCETQYDPERVNVIGCTIFWQEDEGVYALMAADGVETEVYVDSISLDYSRGNGYLLVASRNGMYGVINWHGEEVLPFEHIKPIIISDDTNALIRTGTGMELVKVE